MRTITPMAPLVCALLVSACRNDGLHRTTGGAVALADQAVVHRIWAGGEEISGPTRDGRFAVSPGSERNQMLLRDLTSGTVREAVPARPLADGTWYAALAASGGRSIAFVWENAKADFRSELHVADVASGAMRVLFTGTESLDYAQPLDWSRDGRHILVGLRTKQNGNQLALMAADGSGTRVLKSFEWRWPGQATFSPDDRYVAYAAELRRDEITQQVHVLDTQSGREVKVGPAAAGVSFLGWSPGGASLLYSVEEASLTSIWRVPVRNGQQTGQPALVKQGLVNIAPAATTARGVVYRVSDSSRIIELVDLDIESAVIQAAREVIAEPNAWLTWTNAWSRDAEHLAYARNRVRGQPRTAIVLRSLRTGEQREIVIRPPITFVWSVEWDATGEDLILVGADRAQERARYRLRLATGATERLDEPVRDTARLSQDHRHRFHETSTDKVLTVTTEDVQTGARTRVFHGPVGGGRAISPDQNSFAMFAPLQPSGRELVVARLRGPDIGAVRRYRVPNGNFIPPVWTPDNRYLLFSGTEGDVTTPRWDLWRLDAATGELTMIRGLARDRVFAVQLSENGRQLLLSALPRSSSTELWLIDDAAPSRAATGK